MSLAVRPATAADVPFLWHMLTYAASMDGTEADIMTAPTDPNLVHYVDGFPRDGDVGVIAESDGTRIGAAWVRLAPRGVAPSRGNRMQAATRSRRSSTDSGSTSGPSSSRPRDRTESVLRKKNTPAHPFGRRHAEPFALVIWAILLSGLVGSWGRHHTRTARPERRKRVYGVMVPMSMPPNVL
jgi:hypothetical protein